MSSGLLIVPSLLLGNYSFGDFCPLKFHRDHAGSQFYVQHFCTHTLTVPEWHKLTMTRTNVPKAN